MPAAAPLVSVSWRREKEMVDQASLQHAPMQSNRRLTIVIAVAAVAVLLTSVASGDGISLAIGLVIGATISGVLVRRDRVRWVNMMADEGNTVMEFGAPEPGSRALWIASKGLRPMSRCVAPASASTSA